jgi:hypothetical protein
VKIAVLEAPAIEMSTLADQMELVVSGVLELILLLITMALLLLLEAERNLGFQLLQVAVVEDGKCAFLLPSCSFVFQHMDSRTTCYMALSLERMR